MDFPNARWGAFVASFGALVAALLASHAFAAEEKAVPSEPEWKAWILAPPPEPPFTDVPLKEKLAGLPEAQKSDAARFMFDTWDTTRRQELDDLLEGMGTPLFDLVPRWADKDFESVFRRAEEWDGFSGNTLRIALVRQIAQRDPLEAARFMSERLNPMSKQYYYYVLMEGLVPALKHLAVRDHVPIFEASASGVEFMDTFRWDDGIHTLAFFDERWQSPDLDADWRFVLAQKPGYLRDQLLGMVLEAMLERDLASAIKIDVASTGVDSGNLNHSLYRAFPEDVNLALALLPDADTQLMDLWIGKLVFLKTPPDWAAWAKHVLALQPEDLRDVALARFTRLRLKHDEFPARQWSATLPEGRAKTITEREVAVSEIIHRAAESWSEAYDAALALTDAECRQLALLGVFEAGTSEDIDEVNSRAKSASRNTKGMNRLLDSWTTGRIIASSKAGTNVDTITLMLSLRDPVLRRAKLEQVVQSLRSVGYDKVRQLILDSALDEDEKHSLSQALALDRVDAVLSGFHSPDEDGGVKAALEASLQIEDPHLRFIQQRSVVHEATRADIKEARYRIESARLDDDTRARLMKEWERVSRWHGVERHKR